jgi:glycosyltransferase involved in cell wall biosynthesis
MGLLRIAESLPRPLRRLVRRVPGVARLRRALAGTPAGDRPDPGSLRPVVYLPTWERWDEMRQRPQYVVEAFARHGHPVYFVDPREPAPRRVGAVDIVPSLRSVPGHGVILYVHYAPLRDLFGRFDDPVILYDVLDDLSIYDADEGDLPEERRVRFHHGPVVGAADVVMASSEVLADRHRHERPDLLLVQNGVDLDRFDAAHSRPDDLPAGRPVVGYHGAIARWFDFDLLGRVAGANPQWDFVLVGPVLPEVRSAVAGVGERTNVHVLGARPSDAIPAYVQGFDVGAVWFVVDDLTAGVSPLKVFECLAADVPVVSTPLPACVGLPGVRVASTAGEMTAAIEAALVEGPAESGVRRQTAAAAAWERRLEPVMGRLDDLGRRRVPG